MAKETKQVPKKPEAITVISPVDLLMAYETLNRLRGEVDYAIGQLNGALSTANARVAYDRLGRCLDSMERLKAELEDEKANRLGRDCGVPMDSQWDAQ